MTGARLTVWLTAQVGLLMVFSRRDKPGITVGPTGEAITVNAAWTGWQDRRFEGATLFDAVDAAVTTMQASRQ